MSVAPRVRSTTTSAEENEERPVLVPAGNKTSLASPARKSVSKPLRKVEKLNSSPASVYSPPVPPSLKSRVASKRQDTLLHSNLSLNASCSSDCSMESFRSRASTGRIGSRASLSSRRKQGLPRPETILSKLEKIVPDGIVITPLEAFHRKRRCSWVTPTTDPCYAAFHDEEWGVPVHDDKKLFELLVFSGALAELTWPVILSKRQIFREVFLDFDPAAVSKLSEKKITAQGSLACSLLSEPKLRAVIENARQIVKLIEEFGSFDKYCWNFVNNKPIVSKFRYSRQVPVKTAKADVISKDMVRRGFRSVGPTVIYSFMQVSGITNDHLISCYRFEECCSPSTLDVDKKDESILPSNGKIEEDLSLIIPIDGTPMSPRREGNLELEFAKVVEDLSFS